MKKIGKVIYKKLLAQAEEAEVRDLHKISTAIKNSIGPIPEEEIEVYSKKELEDDLYNDLWKVATNIIKYYDVQSIDAEKLSAALDNVAEIMLEEVKASINIEEDFGASEPKLIGEIL